MLIIEKTIAATIIMIPCFVLPLAITKAPKTIPRIPKIIGAMNKAITLKIHPRIINIFKLVSFFVPR